MACELGCGRHPHHRLARLLPRPIQGRDDSHERVSGAAFAVLKPHADLLPRYSVLNKIIQLTVETNGLTAAVAVIDAVLFATLTTSWHVLPNLCLIKLYFNSLLVSRGFWFF